MACFALLHGDPVVGRSSQFDKLIDRFLGAGFALGLFSPFAFESKLSPLPEKTKPNAILHWVQTFALADRAGVTSSLRSS